jgi:Cu2+-exporting ATPase
MSALAGLLPAGETSARGAAARAPAAGRCFHCEQALPADSRREEIDGRARDFCCAGCAAAASWIRDAGLGSYYRLRTAPGSVVAPCPADLTVWDREEVIGPHVRNVPAGREITVLTDGLRCAACAWLVDRALAREPGVLEVSANATTGRIRLAWDPARRPLSALLGILAGLGYTPYLADGAAGEEARRAERRRWLLRTGIAGLATLQAMMFAEALYLDTSGTMPAATRDFLRWVTFLVATPVIFYSGWPFLSGAWHELRLRRFGMDTLVATSALIAWGASLFETLRGGAQVWYDTAVMFVFLLLIARLLEQRARELARTRVDALARARPALAERETADGLRETVPVSHLAAGDLIHVPAGMAVPADGTLCAAPAAFSEALLTGESRPVLHEPGEEILAGTACADAATRIRVTRAGDATRLSELARLVEAAQAQRPRLARLADRVAARFVLGLFACALAVYLVWHVIAPARAFEVTLALLVISCPCALSLAVPAALAAVHEALLKLGALAVRPDALAPLARATDVVFDKTGTLTTGTLELLATRPTGALTADEALRLAAGLARDSAHPLAGALRAAAAGLTAAVTAGTLRERAGQGLEGEIDGRGLRLGTASFAAGGDDADGLWLGDGHAALARFELREQLRPDAVASIAALRAAGFELHLYSGDGPQAVAACADALGIADRRARLLPEDKLALLRALQARGRVVAMIGDGLNDAPVLAAADASIAMAGDTASGVALAQRAADIVWTRPALGGLAALFDVARRSQRIIRGNFTWAVAYNLVALPLAAAGLVTPWIAALAMVGSSLTVTLNALRLARYAPATAARA